MRDDQQDVINFLSQPSTYGCLIKRVDLVETHVSLVFLAGDRAYKLKRAVKYPYLDFSTADCRRQVCEAELALNRRTAPSMYLEVRSLVRLPDGGIAFGREGPAVDWIVVMRRFDQAMLFDTLANRGRLTSALMLEVVDQIVAFHAAAEQRFEFGGAASVIATVQVNHRCLITAQQVAFNLQTIDRIRETSLRQLARVSTLLDRRRAEGKVRRCHGDLHLRNICLFESSPTLFDCLEFSEELATIDILYDLAFLLMDLEHRGLSELDNLVLNRYLDLTGEDDGLAAIPLFTSLRAAIRAHVTATAAQRTAHPEFKPAIVAEAQRYLDLADRLLCERSPRLISIGGLSGSGKSTLAAALSSNVGGRVLRSDVIRKQLFTTPPEAPLPLGAYTSEISQQVYAVLCSRAAAALEAGYSVIIDAVALKPEERGSFAALANSVRVPFNGLWLEAPAEVMEGRIRARHRDASDATPQVLAWQLHQDPGPIDWVRIDVRGDQSACEFAARKALDLSTIVPSADRRS